MIDCHPDFSFSNVNNYRSDSQSSQIEQSGETLSPVVRLSSMLRRLVPLYTDTGADGNRDHQRELRATLGLSTSQTALRIRNRLRSAQETSCGKPDCRHVINVSHKMPSNKQTD